MIGESVRRVEDQRLITGQGRYVDDIHMEGMLHAVFIRSIEAHAVVGPVAFDEGYRGSATLHTAASLGLVTDMPVQNPSAVMTQPTTAAPLASTEVCYVGQPIAVVVAPTVSEATDAVDYVSVDYDPLPFVIDHRLALVEDAPPCHMGSASNLIATLSASFGDTERAFAEAPNSVSFFVDQHRGALASMEGRAVLGRWDNTDRTLSLWTSSQSPHAVRDHVSAYLGLSPDDLRVITPDVGGGFGPKAAIYAEEFVVAALAIAFDRPVKWTELRREHFVATAQARGQSGTVEVAFDDDGVVRSIRADLVHDCGAFVPYGVVMALTTPRLMSGPYTIDAVSTRIDCVFTNATPTGAIRGAGRPNATFAVERAIDAVARDLGLDRAEVRRRNLIQPDQLPYQIDIPGSDGRPISYDSGDYPAALESAIETAAIASFESRREESAARGLLRGYGIASYVEDTGLGPYDGARIEILPNGDVVVEVGTSSQGQGHATVFTQIVSEHLGVDPDRVRVHGGDTGRYGQGIGTVASRTGQTTTSAVHVAGEALAATVKDLAAAKIEASPGDIVLRDGSAMVIGQPGSEIPLGQLSADMQPKFGSTFPEGQHSPGLSVERVVPYGGSAFTYGTHIAEVEIDPLSGHVKVLSYCVVHDCGTLLNPMIVDGQIDGGVAHGLGNALMESVQFWDSGQPMTTSFMDYRLMTAVDMPELTKVHMEIPSPTNALGAKGAGEGGTIPAAAAVASAVEHALSDHDVIVNHYPITSEWVHASITGAG